jgi:hypothetical protein
VYECIKIGSCGISGVVTGVIKEAYLLDIEIVDEKPACEGDRIMN